MLVYKIHLFQALFICLAAVSTQVVAHPKGAAASVDYLAAKAYDYPSAAYGYGYPYAYSYSPIPNDANPDGAAIPVDKPSIQGARAVYRPTSTYTSGAYVKPYSGLVSPGPNVINLSTPVIY